MSAEDGRGANLETACHAGCLDQVPLRTVPVGLHVVSLEAGEYTLELMPVSATDDACGFGLERAFPVPEGDTPEAWAEALERGLGGAGACGDGSGRVRNLLVIPEPGEYLLAIVERVDFRRYPPDARQGVCGQYEVTLVSGYHWCSSE